MDGDGDEGNSVAFHYVKGQFFRVIRADGAIGGSTPQGFVHAALYSERPAIPQRIVHRITPEGELGEQLPDKTVTRGGIVREMEIDLFVTAETAQTLGEWLIARAQEIRERTEQSKRTEH